MKFEIPPAEVSDLMPFSSLPSSESKSSFAGVSKNGLWMWIVNDTSINLYHTENSEWFGSYCFEKSLNSSVRITAVAEFSSSHIPFSCLLIAVNQEDESIICLYDINKSQVVRAVLIPDKVTSLEVVSGNGGACMETHYLFMQLRCMFGIVAVGTSSGHIFFLDLCLDEDFTCSENLPNITFVLKKYELLPERREKAISKQQHILMLLNDQSVRNGSFEFESRSSSLGHFPYGKVRVTALKYILNSVALAVGFNFGGIQLWGLQDLCLLYTVSNQPQEQPIIAFAFQEPENDPRHFCYLWIIRGHLINERPEDFSVATMYALVYDKRTYMESFGYLYTDLRNCFKRFEYRMTSDPFSAAQSSSAAGSCLLSCQTICQTDESHYLDVCSANDSDTASESMSLCFLSWTVWSHSENTPTSYHLALFDLNQWYRAEMPSSNFRSELSDLNPYFAHFSLEEVAQIFDLEPLLGLHVIPHSIKKFKYYTPSEEFFFPSALDYQTIAFSPVGTCKTYFIGLQKRLLYEISDTGPNILVNPKDIFSNLVRCGLVSDPHISSDRVPLLVQRETLMQLALEYHMPPFFMKCLKEWRYADSIQEGCTSRALLNWAWKKVTQIKNSIDKLSIPLFNCSDTNIDKGPLKCLYSYRRQLDLIDTILMGYQKFAAPRTEQGIQELLCRKNVVSCINMYLQVMLWLRSVDVLPEVCEGDETERNMLYPANALFNSYLKRRSLLRKIHNSIGPTDILLIDGLIKEAFSENTWQEKGGNGIYPPPSVYAALTCYLLDDIPLELKHSLMYYVLLDICDAPHNRKNLMASKVKKFPSVFGMSQSVSRLVKAFWYLDQFNFEVAIKKLLEPGIKASDILPWQHHRVIKAFLYQGEAQKALKYINHMEPPEITIEDMKLHLSVLLARGAIIQAFDYQRSKQSVGCGLELLNHLFLGCQETDKLKDLIYMPLNSFESSALVKFLSENDDPRAQETLVIYYLLRCNYFEAAKVNEKLSLTSMGRSTNVRERIAGRDALVEGLLNSVPKMEKNLVNEISRFPSFPVQKLEALKPLSLSIKSVPMKQVTYSDILNSLISEASSAMCAPYLEPQTPLRSANRSNYENLPFLRPPLTPERTKLPSDNIHSTPVAKRTLTSPSSEFSSPSKRSRLLDSAPFRSPLSKKKLPKHLAGDVASLLQSPPIPRRSSKNSKSTPSKDSPATAPQGILKKKSEPAKFSSSDFFTSKTPSVLSDAGEDSEDSDGEDNEMNVDEAPDDIPERQIRFSVPSKEDLNTSTYSNISAESAVSSVSHESSSFLKKLEELKPLPSMEPVDFNSREFTNVTRRKTLLTREPLKSHTRISPEKTLSFHKNNLITSQNPPAAENTLFSLKDSLQQKHIEPAVEVSDSDSCPALEGESKKDDYKISSVQSSSLMYSSSLSSVKVTEPSLSASTPVAEAPLNKSSSSSGNSSYNSAISERSFIITPRKPLRENSRSASISSTSVLSTQEDDKNEIILGEAVPEEMIIDDNDENSSHHSAGEEEVSIIAEVTIPPERNAEPDSQPMEEECICVDISDSERTVSQPIEKSLNQDLDALSEKNKYELVHKPFLPNEESNDIEQVFDSHEQNNNNHMINRIEQSDFQNHFYNADQIIENQLEINYVEQLNTNQISDNYQLNVNQISSDNINANKKQSNNFESIASSAEQCSSTQNQISSLEHCSDFQNQISSTEQCSDIQSQISSSEQCSDIQNQISSTEQCSDFQNQISSTEHCSDIQNQISSTEQCSDIQSQISSTEQSSDIQNTKQCSDIQNQIVNVDNINKTKNKIPSIDPGDSNQNVSSTECLCDNSNQISKKNNAQISVTKSTISSEIKNNTNEKTVAKEAKEHQSEVDNAGEQVSQSSEYATALISEEKIVKSGYDCIVKVSTDSTEVQVDESTESCSSEMFNYAKDTSSVPEYIPIKERISRAQQSGSRSSKFDDDEDQTYPSLLLQEQLEFDKGGIVTSKQPAPFKPEKLESVTESSEFMVTDSREVESSQDMETDFHEGDSADSKPVSSTTSSSTKDISQRLTERFDFLSKNSEFYENNKLYRETMTLLKSDMPFNLDYEIEKKPSRKTRTFVFKKEEKKTETKTTKSEDLEQKVDKDSSEKFLESWHPETYEQFSSSLQKGRPNSEEKESLKSSPNVDLQKSSVSLLEKTDESVLSSSKLKGRKKQESVSKDSSVDKKERPSIKKAKGKGKARKKMEFSFAEPHSPAGPEVLEALTTPSQYPVGSFMFSPPLTRGRLRQKKMDDTLGSSFASVASETSFVNEKKPPVDPILQGIIDERMPETQKLMTSVSKRKTKTSHKKKATSKKLDKTDVSQLDLSDSSIDTSQMIEIDSPAISKVHLSTRQTAKHRMVLRQTKTKPRTEQLF